MQLESHIPFNEPFFDTAEEKAARRTLRSGCVQGNGPICQRVEQQLRSWLDVDHVLLTGSCTHALEMGMLVLDVGPGDEVIMPSYNFPSAANAVVLRGGIPVFAEIRPETMNLDVDAVASRITERTKAIVAVHYGGIGCDMARLMQLADEHGLYLIEDAAQAVDARYGGRPLGTLGDIGCYSFHETKNITCGEGGAFLTRHNRLARRAEEIREKGTNRPSFLRGEVDSYGWTRKGGSYVLSDVLAAVLEAQLAKREEIRVRRRTVWGAYYEALLPLAETGSLVLPTIPDRCQPNYHLFYFRVADKAQRQRLLRALRNQGIEAAFHYTPLHASTFGSQYASERDAFAVTQECSDTMIRLPLHPALAERASSLAAAVRTVVVRQVEDPGHVSHVPVTRPLMKVSDQPVFVVGNPRSGTTLLRLMLTSHPNIAVPPEGTFITDLFKRYGSFAGDEREREQFARDVLAVPKMENWKLPDLAASLRKKRPQSYRELVSGVYEHYIEVHQPGKRRWGDKNNYYLRHLPKLGKLFEEARFVHIVRDGRDVACSYRDVAGVQGLHAPDLPTSVIESARHWSGNLRRIRRDLDAVGRERVYVVRYEDLVQEPDKVLRGICTFLEEEYTDQMLAFDQRNRREGLVPAGFATWKKRTWEPIDASRAYRWHREMFAEGVAFFDREAGDLLADYGYETPAARNDPSVRSLQAVYRLLRPALQPSRTLRKVARRVQRTMRTWGWV